MLATQIEVKIRIRSKVKNKQEVDNTMQWSEVRTTYPAQWLVIEALEAHTENELRVLDQISVVETCSDGSTAMQRYRQLHREYPLREFYFVHTDRETLDIRQRQWIGIRRNHAVNPA
jgi:hypothetical protein